MARYGKDESSPMIRPRIPDIIGDEPPPTCPYCLDTECTCAPPEDVVCLTRKAQWLSYEYFGNEDSSGDTPRPRCPYCGDTDCVCPPPEHCRPECGTR